MSRFALAAVASFALLAGCGGDDDADENVLGSGSPAPSSSASSSPGSSPSVTPTATPSSSISPVLRACYNDMVRAMTKAYNETRDLPEDDRGLAYAAALGELPAPCTELDNEQQKQVLAAAKEKAPPSDD